MASRPPDFPEWASGSAVVVEPNSTKKAQGHLVEERPLAQFVNWILKTIYLWILYFDAPVNQRTRYPTDVGNNGVASTWINAPPSDTYHNTSAAHDWWISTHERTNDIIRSCVGRVNPNGRVVTVTLLVYAAGVIVFEAGKASTAGVGDEDVTIDPTTVPSPATGTWDHTLVAGERVWVKFTSTAGSSNQTWIRYADIYADTDHA